MDELTLLADLHKAGLRQGPGSPDVTRRAMGLAGLDGSRPLEIADIGCGTGGASLELARMLDARITAVDFLPSFLDVLRQRAQAQGLGRIITLEASMDALPFTDASFDVIWSEGAVYNLRLEHPPGNASSSPAASWCFPRSHGRPPHDRKPSRITGQHSTRR